VRPELPATAVPVTTVAVLPFAESKLPFAES